MLELIGNDLRELNLQDFRWLVKKQQKNNFAKGGEAGFDIYNYDDFVESIKFIIKKSKITILKSTVKVDSKTAMWELKVKK